MSDTLTGRERISLTEVARLMHGIDYKTLRKSLSGAGISTVGIRPRCITLVDLRRVYAEGLPIYGGKARIFPAERTPAK